MEMSFSFAKNIFMITKKGKHFLLYFIKLIRPAISFLNFFFYDEMILQFNWRRLFVFILQKMDKNFV